MSTRCNILLKDSRGDELWFYRHADGHPERAMPIIATFVNYVTTGRILATVSQAGGWLIVLGIQESELLIQPFHEEALTPGGTGDYMGWKVGTIEPITEEHGDIEYRYTITLSTLLDETQGFRGAASVLCEQVRHLDYGSNPPVIEYRPVDITAWLVQNEDPTPESARLF